MALKFKREIVDQKKLLQKTKAKKAEQKAVKNIPTALSSDVINRAYEKLKHHEGEYITIRDIMTFDSYMKKVYDNGTLALDTETTGLNPKDLELVGLCLYVPDDKPAYVPINHKSSVTLMRIKDQLTEEQIRPYLLKLAENKVKNIYHNAKYDIRVLMNTCGVELDAEWDTMLASYCINEEGSHALKDLHFQLCDTEDTEALLFNKLFDGVRFDFVPIKIASLYAAGDAIKTYELYKKQQTILNRRSGDIYKVFKDIEMKVLKAVVHMEEYGVELDLDYSKKLSEKYHKLHEQATKTTEKVMEQYKDVIEEYKMRNLNAKIEYPVKLSSPTQLAILFYDILKVEPPDKKKPRGTGVDELKAISKKGHKGLIDCILKMRELEKLIGTYIDKLPNTLEKDNRVHGSYHQYGAKTGRFSSNSPNLQNIPSHNTEIRKMFYAGGGRVFVGADYSQQEVFVTAYLAHDEKMQTALKNGKDIYATIASIAFHTTYEDCLEFRPDGTTNKEGKARRTAAKSIVLGILYGRSIPSIAEQLNCSVKEAQNIYDSVIKAFPALGKLIKDSQNMAREKGYVTTAWGRRRHLEDMQLDKYVFKYSDNVVAFDPLAFDSDNTDVQVPEKLKRDLTKQLDNAWGFKQKQIIKERAMSLGIEIIDNSSKIAQAERQCVNARVQGSAADCSKLALILLDTDPIMKKLDFHAQLMVHDEIIGSCPYENRKEVAERLSYLMRTAPTEKIDLPFRCDTTCTKVWYGEELDLE